MAACKSCGHESLSAEDRKANAVAEHNLRLLELVAALRSKGTPVDVLVKDAIELQKFTREPEGWGGE